MGIYVFNLIFSMENMVFFICWIEEDDKMQQWNQCGPSNKTSCFQVAIAFSLDSILYIVNIYYWVWGSWNSLIVSVLLESTRTPNISPFLQWPCMSHWFLCSWNSILIEYSYDAIILNFIISEPHEIQPFLCYINCVLKYKSLVLFPQSSVVSLFIEINIVFRASVSEVCCLKHNQELSHLVLFCMQ